ncbi:hypothetical protein FNF29_01583 [Cafeteria roenbergensis]|uniref:Uncharacterized protein n=2 Tax=Cafeteria roenbergensis TaxID=33653 RepID=A0A5A8CSE9_CAFRO|nr:hypothetical protein FNF29_01583 [Cafeteria roenbergensis]|eukprot:KAA0155668.1 hypothetical protein FNF29_01583 [Cafeteria roenbergensis]
MAGATMLDVRVGDLEDGVIANIDLVGTVPAAVLRRLALVAEKQPRCVESVRLAGMTCEGPSAEVRGAVSCALSRSQRLERLVLGPCTAHGGELLTGTAAGAAELAAAVARAPKLAEVSVDCRMFGGCGDASRAFFSALGAAAAAARPIALFVLNAGASASDCDSVAGLLGSPFASKLRKLCLVGLAGGAAASLAAGSRLGDAVAAVCRRASTLGLQDSATTDADLAAAVAVASGDRSVVSSLDLSVSDASADGVEDFGPAFAWLSCSSGRRAALPQHLSLRRGPLRITAEAAPSPALAPASPTGVLPPAPACFGPAVAAGSPEASRRVWASSDRRSACLAGLAAAVEAATSGLVSLDVSGLLGEPVGLPAAPALAERRGWDDAAGGDDADPLDRRRKAAAAGRGFGGGLGGPVMGPGGMPGIPFAGHDVEDDDEGSEGEGEEEEEGAGAVGEADSDDDAAFDGQDGGGGAAAEPLTPAQALLAAGRTGAAGRGARGTVGSSTVCVTEAAAGGWAKEFVARALGGFPAVGASAMIAGCHDLAVLQHTTGSEPSSSSSSSSSAAATFPSTSTATGAAAEAGSLVQAGSRMLVGSKATQCHSRMLRLLALVSLGPLEDGSEPVSAGEPERSDASSWYRLLSASRSLNRLCIGGCGLDSATLDGWIAGHFLALSSQLPARDWAAGSAVASADALEVVADSRRMFLAPSLLDVSGSPRLGLGSVARLASLCRGLTMLLADDGTGSLVRPSSAAVAQAGKEAGAKYTGPARAPTLGPASGTYDDMGGLALHPGLRVLALPALRGGAVNGLAWGLGWRASGLVSLHLDACPRALRLMEAATAALPTLLCFSVGRGVGGVPWEGGAVITPLERRQAALGAADASMATSWTPVGLTASAAGGAAGAAGAAAASAARREPTCVLESDAAEGAREARPTFNRLLDVLSPVPSIPLRVCRILGASAGSAAGVSGVLAALVSIRGRRALHADTSLAVLRLEVLTGPGAPRSDALKPAHRAALARRRSDAVLAARRPMLQLLTWARHRHAGPGAAATPYRGSRPGAGAFMFAKSPGLVRKVVGMAGTQDRLSTPLLDLAVQSAAGEAEAEEGQWLAGAAISADRCRATLPAHMRVQDLQRRQERLFASRKATDAATTASRPRRPVRAREQPALPVAVARPEGEGPGLLLQWDA